MDVLIGDTKVAYSKNTFATAKQKQLCFFFFSSTVLVHNDLSTTVLKTM